MTWKMLDVSSNNHPNEAPIDWHHVVNAGYRGVMIKATEGAEYVNPWLVRDAHGARAAGMHVGYYWYARPEQGGAAEQASYALLQIVGLPRDLGLALDLEESGGRSWADLAGFAKAGLDTVAAESIGSPIYCNPDWLAHLPGAPFGHHLWLASWGKRPRRQVWSWQSGQADVPGIVGPVDVGTYYG